MTDSLIKGLGYLGVTVTDLDDWQQFNDSVVGLELVYAKHGERRYKMDERVHRLVVRHAPDAALEFVGWELRTESELSEMGRRLLEAGIPTTEASSDDCGNRGVAGLVSCSDPDGNKLELFYGARSEEAKPFRPPLPLKFVTGDQGMGHVVFTTSRYEEMVHFYAAILGFRTTDFMLEPHHMQFLGTNPRHHSVALFEAPPGGGSALQHVMFEVDTLDSVGRAYDLCLAGAAPIVGTLGRHWNDHMVSFYARSPAGFDVEIGWGGRVIDRDTWSCVQGTGEISTWGHQFNSELPPAGFRVAG